MDLLSKLAALGILTDERDMRFGGIFGIAGGPPIGKHVATTVTTAGAATYTAAALIGGQIRRDPAGASRTDVLPTHALVYAALRYMKAPMAFMFTIVNTADADESITLTAGTGITISGRIVVPPRTSMTYMYVIESATAANVYCIASTNVRASDICTPATITTAGAATYTIAQFLGRLLLRDPAGAGRSDVTPTATAIVNGIDGAIAGTTIEFDIRNTADADETITVTAGTGVTLSGTMTIAQNKQKRFRLHITNADTPAVTIYSMGEVTF